jgi:nicotinamidase-related amidase
MSTDETIMSFEARYYKLYPAGHFDGLTMMPLSVDLTTAALLVVDVYGLGFTPAEGGPRHHPSFDDETTSPWDQVAQRAIAPALEAARRVGLPVVYAHNSGPRIELNRSQIGRVLNRTLGCDLEELFRERDVDPREYYTGTENLFLETSSLVGPKDGDYFIRKHQYSGFKDTRLDTLLRNRGITTLFCMGFDAGTCLKMTMVDAFELNYELVLLRDAALAAEIPEDEARGYSFTERIIWWMEAHICTSITSGEFTNGLDLLPAGRLALATDGPAQS